MRILKWLHGIPLAQHWTIWRLKSSMTRPTNKVRVHGEAMYLRWPLETVFSMLKQQETQIVNKSISESTTVCYLFTLKCSMSYWGISVFHHVYHHALKHWKEHILNMNFACLCVQTVHVWRWEDNLKEVVVSLHYVRPEDWSLVANAFIHWASSPTQKGTYFNDRIIGPRISKCHPSHSHASSWLVV